MDALTVFINQLKYFQSVQQAEHENHCKLLQTSLTPKGEIPKEKSALLQDAAKTLRINEARRTSENERASNEAIQQMIAQDRLLADAVDDIRAQSFIQRMQKRTPLALPTYLEAERVVPNDKILQTTNAELKLPNLRKRKIPDKGRNNSHGFFNEPNPTAQTSENEEFMQCTSTTKVRITDNGKYDSKSGEPVFEFKYDPSLNLMDVMSTRMEM